MGCKCGRESSEIQHPDNKYNAEECNDNSISNPNPSF